ncbi:hypothetical protein [Candidatus Electronema sp. JC]|uniref:hypothetical protein n=1 Tax=Candidatus Electronema sp. JC TaxID=3401570 RepID=UPI003B43D40C
MVHALLGEEDDADKNGIDTVRSIQKMCQVGQIRDAQSLRFEITCFSAAAADRRRDRRRHVICSFANSACLFVSQM